MKLCRIAKQEAESRCVMSTYGCLYEYLSVNANYLLKQGFQYIKTMNIRLKATVPPSKECVVLIYVHYYLLY